MRVLLCNKLHYPAGDAGSIRQYKLAKMLRELGHEVFVVGLGPASGFLEQTYKGIPYVSLRQGNNRFAEKALSHLLYWPRIRKVLRKWKPDVLIMDDMGCVTTIQMKCFCKKRKIKMIHDSVEWYSPEQFRRGKLAIGYIKKDILNCHLLDSSYKVIAISRYLEEYFATKGIETVRIPIVIEADDLSQKKELKPEKTVFTYAGQPGKKDFLPVMLESFALLEEEEREKAIFHVVGCNREQMIASGIQEDLLNKLSSHLVIHGRVDHTTVLELLKETDFTVLIRDPNQRYAKAGFPSKVVESLANATPVLCNYSSDLRLYLQDGENAIIAQEPTSESVVSAMRKALALTIDDRKNMCNLALKTAKEHFDMRLYLDLMRKILGQ